MTKLEHVMNAVTVLLVGASGDDDFRVLTSAHATLCAAVTAYGRDCADRAREECATIVRNAAVYGCACSDREELARLICAGTEGEGSHV